MRLFGLEIKRAPSLSPVSSRGTGGWWPVIREPFAGAFQRDIEWTTDSVLAHHAVYTCITLIASDIGKLRPKLVQLTADGIWEETASAAFSPVLRKPNRFQNRIQFIEWWVMSKLTRGNTYALKERDERKVVTALYLLDPARTTVLVAPDGAVYYQLQEDPLSGLRQSVTVPASEIIHDRMNCLFHPLVGVSPIFACGAAAHVGLKVQDDSASFFGNGSNPSGVLTAPARISQEVADRLKKHWDENYSGANSGKVAVLGDGLEFKPMRMSAVDSQLIEQLKWTAETACSTFHVPAFKVGVGAQPTYQNAEIMNQIYYSDCLQSLIEQFELCMDEGLGLDEPKDGKTLGVELDLDSLLRMDTAAQMATLAEGVGSGILAPDEARKKLDRRPVKGGHTPYLQQQNYSLAALDARDQAGPPPNSPGDRRAPTPILDERPQAPPVDEGDDDDAKGLFYWETAEAECEHGLALTGWQ